ncbi:MAG: hypothetical protein R3263_05380 [Myxococcota bacterium]|nr:hypothetical protein [Myxococcota bacterium]
MSGAVAAPARAPEEPLALPLRVLLLALLLDAGSWWYVRVPVATAAALGLLLPGLLTSRALWAALAALVAWPLAWNWPFSDNHDYLRAFACVAVVASLGAGAPRATLATSARWLLGLTFLFATLWKVALSPDYLDGRFFRVTLLTDVRFENLAVLLGGLTWQGWEAGADALRAAAAGRATPGASGPVEPEALRRLAWGLTLWTGLLEAAIAVTFLAPRGRALARLRDPLLLVFGATTFAFATVRGFGWLLAALGAAQTEPERRRTRLAYVGLFVLVEVYRSVPWSGALVQALGRTGAAS